MGYVRGDPPAQHAPTPDSGHAAEGGSSSHPEGGWAGSAEGRSIPCETRRSGRVAEGGALLRRYVGEYLHRGFESLLLRWRGGRAVECGGLENRYPSLGGSRVQIPPPPLDLAKTRMVSGFSASPPLMPGVTGSAAGDRYRPPVPGPHWPAAGPRGVRATGVGHLLVIARRARFLIQFPSRSRRSRSDGRSGSIEVLAGS